MITEIGCGLGVRGSYLPRPARFRPGFYKAGRFGMAKKRSSANSKPPDGVVVALGILPVGLRNLERTKSKARSTASNQTVANDWRVPELTEWDVCTDFLDPLADWMDAFLSEWTFGEYSHVYFAKSENDVTPYSVVSLGLQNCWSRSGIEALAELGSNGDPDISFGLVWLAVNAGGELAISLS